MVRVRKQPAAASPAPPEGHPPEAGATAVAEGKPPRAEQWVQSEPEASGRPTVHREGVASIEQLTVHPDNPRRHNDEESLAELAASIRQFGVLEPLLVRRDTRKPWSGGDVFEHGQVLAGSRRLAAAKLAGLTQVPVRWMDVDDRLAVEIMLTENLQRRDVHPLEEAEGIALLRDRCGMDYRAIATRLGKSVGYVHGRARLATLQPDVKKAWSRGWLELGHVQVFATLQPADQDELLKWLDRSGHAPASGVNTTVEKLVAHVHREVLLDLKSAPWRKDDAHLVETAGACSSCPHRTSSQRELFPGVSSDRCTNPACFRLKLTSWGHREIAREEEKAGAKLLRVTESHRKPSPDALTWKAWVRVPKSQRCKEVQRAALVDESGIAREFLDVCATRGCRVHWDQPAHASKGKTPEVGAAKQETWQERQQREDMARKAKEQRELPVRNAMVAALRAALVADRFGTSIPVPRALLDQVVHAGLDRLSWQRSEFWRAVGIPASDPSRMPTRELLLVLLELIVFPWKPHGYAGSNWLRNLKAFAKAAGVSKDVEAAEAAVLQQQRDERKAAKKVRREADRKLAKAAKAGKKPPVKPGVKRRACRGGRRAS